MLEEKQRGGHRFRFFVHPWSYSRERTERRRRLRLGVSVCFLFPQRLFLSSSAAFDHVNFIFRDVRGQTFLQTPPCVACEKLGGERTTVRCGEFLWAAVTCGGCAGPPAASCRSPGSRTCSWWRPDQSRPSGSLKVAGKERRSGEYAFSACCHHILVFLLNFSDLVTALIRQPD